MEKKIISISHRMRSGMLDDDYTLYDSGEILHEYDKHTYPGGYNLSETLSVENLNMEIKKRLIDAATEENKEIVREVLGL